KSKELLRLHGGSRSSRYNRPQLVDAGLWSRTLTLARHGDGHRHRRKRGGKQDGDVQRRDPRPDSATGLSACDLSATELASAVVWAAESRALVFQHRTYLGEN